MSSGQAQFDNLIAAINKEFGQNTIYRPTDDISFFKVGRVSTGNYKLDLDLGGGLPTGRVHLITGPFSCGKSYLMYKVFAQYTSRKHRVALIDAEITHDPAWAEKCGVDNDLLYVVNPKDAESASDLAELLTGSGQFGCIGLDSIAALIPKEIKDENTEKVTMGKEAKINNKMFKKILSQQNELRTSGKLPPTFLAINQIRENPGVMFGSKEVLPGGKMQQYAATCWIDFRAKETVLDKNDVVVGMMFQHTIKKNKTHPPRKTGLVGMFVDEYMGMHKGDWDVHASMIDVATDLGVLFKDGKLLSSVVSDEAGNVIDEGVLEGKKRPYKHVWENLRDNPDFQQNLLAAVRAKLPEGIEFAQDVH